MSDVPPLPRQREDDTPVAAPAPEADLALIEAARGGDAEATATLFRRHHPAAVRFARTLAASANDAEDIAAEGFARVLTALKAGKGPNLAFRPYLLTTVKRIHLEQRAGAYREAPVEELEPYVLPAQGADRTSETFSTDAAIKAFASLPQRWQEVLWHTEVEGAKPAAIAASLGMSARSVSALAFRAREGLRQAWLQAHIAEDVPEACQGARKQLGAYVRNGLGPRQEAVVRRHLDECGACTAIYLELAGENTWLPAIVAPALLGIAALTAYLKAGGVILGSGLVGAGGAAAGTVAGSGSTGTSAGAAGGSGTAAGSGTAVGSGTAAAGSGTAVAGSTAAATGAGGTVAGAAAGAPVGVAAAAAGAAPAAAAAGVGAGAATGGVAGIVGTIGAALATIGRAFLTAGRAVAAGGPATAAVAGIVVVAVATAITLNGLTGNVAQPTSGNVINPPPIGQPLPAPGGSGPGGAGGGPGGTGGGPGGTGGVLGGAGGVLGGTGGGQGGAGGGQGGTGSGPTGTGGVGPGRTGTSGTGGTGSGGTGGTGTGGTNSVPPGSPTTPPSTPVPTAAPTTQPTTPPNPPGPPPRSPEPTPPRPTPTPPQPTPTTEPTPTPPDNTPPPSPAPDISFIVRLPADPVEPRTTVAVRIRSNASQAVKARVALSATAGSRATCSDCAGLAGQRSVTIPARGSVTVHVWVTNQTSKPGTIRVAITGTAGGQVVKPYNGTFDVAAGGVSVPSPGDQVSGRTFGLTVNNTTGVAIDLATISFDAAAAFTVHCGLGITIGTTCISVPIGIGPTTTIPVTITHHESRPVQVTAKVETTLGLVEPAAVSFLVRPAEGDLRLDTSPKPQASRHLAYLSTTADFDTPVDVSVTATDRDGLPVEVACANGPKRACGSATVPAHMRGKLHIDLVKIPRQLRGGQVSIKVTTKNPYIQHAAVTAVVHIKGLPS